MSTIKYFLTVSFLVIAGKFGISQEDYRSSALEKFSEEDVSLIKKSEMLIEENADFYSLAYSDFKSGSFKNAIKGFEKSSKIFIEEYRNEYNIYRENLEKLSYKTDEASKKRTIDKLMEISANFFRESISFRKEADLASDENVKCENYIKAHESEINAILNQSLAVAVFYDISKYRYKEEKNEGLNIKDETGGFSENSYGVDKNSGRYSAFAENPVYSGYVENYSNNQNSGNKTGNYSSANVVTTPGVTYKVQIASSENPLPENKIRNIFPGQNNVSLEKSQNKYKYVFGNFNSYPEAANARDVSGVNGAFIIVYRNGQRVISKTEQKQLIPQIYQKPQTFNSSNSVQTGDVEFRIQIGVSRIPATKAQIALLNPTNLEVKTYKSANFYKFTIGSFATYDEALNYRNANGLSTSFVVKYKNGKEIR